jgi:predicted amidophosphoribosyltransferase
VFYTGPARPLLRAWKEDGLRRAAPLVADLVAALVAPPAVDVVTSVPPDPVRQLARGRHPAVELAAALARRWQLDAETVLERTGTSRRQTGLDRSHRSTNIRGAFRAVADVPPHVLLVDDVYTTGATASAAAAALRRAGAASVHLVTFARTVR